MSPEQIRGEPLDERADVYSFGCTIFHLVAGRAALHGQQLQRAVEQASPRQIPAIEAQDRNITTEFGDVAPLDHGQRPQVAPDSMAKFLGEFRGMQMFKKPPSPQAPTPRKRHLSALGKQLTNASKPTCGATFIEPGQGTFAANFPLRPRSPGRCRRRTPAI